MISQEKAVVVKMLFQLLLPLLSAVSILGEFKLSEVVMWPFFLRAPPIPCSMEAVGHAAP